MATKSVQNLLEDIRSLSERKHQIVEAVRALIRKTFAQPGRGSARRAQSRPSLVLTKQLKHHSTQPLMCR